MTIVRARLGQYAKWQLRDYILGPGGITIGFVALLIWIAAHTGTIDTRPHGTPSLDWLVGLVGVFGSIFATSNLISDDRARGYYRFLFAKPVGPVRYYGQAFVLRGLLLIAVAALISVVGTLIGRPTFLLGSVISVAVMYVLAGGVTACQSTVWRLAWVGTLVLYLASGPVMALAGPNGSASPGWRFVWRVLHVVLPPFGALDAMRPMLTSAPSWSLLAGPIAWSLGYGLLALVAAALVIRGLEWAR